MFRLCLLLFLTPAILQAQVDQKNLTQVIDWLEIKMTYQYYKTAEDVRWLNTLEFYEPDSTLILKNIYRKGRQKQVYQRVIPLKQLNPHNISIRRSYSSVGRNTDGIEITVPTIQQAPVIKKFVSGRFSANEFSFRIIIPQFLLDSTYNLPDDIKAHLQRAIELVHNPKYNSLSYSESVKAAIKSLRGQFKWKLGEDPGAITGKRSYKNFLGPYRLEIDETWDDNKSDQVRIIIGYDSLENHFYRIEFSNSVQGPDIAFLKLEQGEILKLVGKNANTDEVWEIINLNKHIISRSGKRKVYKRE